MFWRHFCRICGCPEINFLTLSINKWQLFFLWKRSLPRIVVRCTLSPVVRNGNILITFKFFFVKGYLLDDTRQYIFGTLSYSISQTVLVWGVAVSLGLETCSSSCDFRSSCNKPRSLSRPEPLVFGILLPKWWMVFKILVGLFFPAWRLINRKT